MSRHRTVTHRRSDTGGVLTRRTAARSLLCVPALSCLAHTVFAAERFPPPEFTSHTLPTPETPNPPAAVTEYVDLAVLFLCLCCASYLALRRRSRRGLFVLSLFSVAYFGFYREGCICPVGSLQNVVLALSDPSYIIPLTVVGFFVLPLLFCAFFGRTFCSAVCPLGAIQDLFLIAPLRVPRWVDRSLAPLASVYLACAVLLSALGSSFLICRYDPFVRVFRLTGGLGMVLFAGAFLGASTVVGRPYCRFFCPYGVLLSFFSRFSKYHVSITPKDCIQCRLCENSCPFGAIEEALPAAGSQRTPRRTLPVLLLLLVVLGGGFYLAGEAVAPALSRDHPTVLLAERIYLEETSQVEGTTDASKAFRQTGEPVSSLYLKAEVLQRRFKQGSALAGLFVGLVVWWTFLGLIVPQRRSHYAASRSLCVACGRCFLSCPVEHQRIKEARERQ